MANVKARIDKQGNLHVEVNGVEGASCTALTDALVHAVGDVETQELKEEYVEVLPDYIHAQDGGD
jgi:hypothetical protein